MHPFQPVRLSVILDWFRQQPVYHKINDTDIARVRLSLEWTYYPYIYRAI